MKGVECGYANMTIAFEARAVTHLSQVRWWYNINEKAMYLIYLRIRKKEENSSSKKPPYSHSSGWDDYQGIRQNVVLPRVTLTANHVCGATQRG